MSTCGGRARGRRVWCMPPWLTTFLLILHCLHPILFLDDFLPSNALPAIR